MPPAATAPVRTLPAAPAAPAAARAAAPVAIVVGGALAVAALSLLLPWSLAFDPQAWVNWGRDLTRGHLDTSAGPSWKPFPVLLTTPFALAGTVAPALWLVTARAGALLALAGAARLGARLGGPAAGAAAAAAMALSPWWYFNAALGNSEGMLAAAALWAGVAHLDRRAGAALALGAAAALLRPEAWPFLGVYAVWAWRHDRRARPIAAAAAVAVPALWFGPDLLGAGGALGASRAALGTASPGSAQLAGHPGLQVLADGARQMTVPVLACAIAAAVTGPRVLRALAGAAVAWVALVAAMTAAGYAGNPRYLAVASAIACVPAGVAIARAAGRRSPWLGAAVLAVAVGAHAFGDLRRQGAEVAARADRRAALRDLVAAAGGRQQIVGCSRVRAPGFVRSLVAWELDLPMGDLDAPPRRPAVVLRARPYAGGAVAPPLATGGYRPIATAAGWEAWAACGRAPQQGG
jgi:hypothetical protein